jgi:hypothetical protein
MRMSGSLGRVGLEGDLQSLMLYRLCNGGISTMNIAKVVLN